MNLTSSPPQQSGERRAFPGFFLIGMLMAIPGAALVAWSYHLQPAYVAIGFHFLSFAAGVLISLRLGGKAVARSGAHRMLTGSMFVAAAGILMGEFGLGPAPLVVRNVSMMLLGLAQGGILAATMPLLKGLYQRDAAATVNLSGGLMGLGAFVTAMLGALSYSWAEFQGLFVLLALAPFVAASWFFRNAIEAPAPATVSDAIRETRTPLHVLFAALLFFETAAETSVLQWTPLHLILRSGMSPSSALYFLSFYSLALLGGRFIAQALLVRVPHRRLLLVSAGMSWFGILIFGSTNNFIGALMGLAMTAFGFSFVYPLLVERIGNQFREYQPDYFHGIFGLGMLGGFLAPALIAFWAGWSNESSAMTVPLWCSLMVFILLLLLWIESKLSGNPTARS